MEKQKSLDRILERLYDRELSTDEAKASLLEWFRGQIPEKKLSARLIADDPRYDQFEKGYNEAIETLTRNIEGASK